MIIRMIYRYFILFSPFELFIRYCIAFKEFLAFSFPVPNAILHPRWERKRTLQSNVCEQKKNENSILTTYSIFEWIIENLWRFYLFFFRFAFNWISVNIVNIEKVEITSSVETWYDLFMFTCRHWLKVDYRKVMRHLPIMHNEIVNTHACSSSKDSLSSST